MKVLTCIHAHVSLSCLVVIDGVNPVDFHFDQWCVYIVLQGEKGIVGEVGDQGEKGIIGDVGRKVRKQGPEKECYLHTFCTVVKALKKVPT